MKKKNLSSIALLLLLPWSFCEFEEVVAGVVVDDDDDDDDDDDVGV